MRNERGQEIELWETRKRQNRRKPWEVRWRIDAVSKSRSFLTKALAENYRNQLFSAAKDGEVFSLATGEPVSWQRGNVTFFDHATAYARHVWASSAGNTRRTVADNVMRLVLAALDERAMKRDPAPAPMAMVRSALLTYALRFQFNPRAEHEEDRVQPRVVEDEQAAACLAWVARTSRPLSDFANQDAALGLLERACIKLKGAGVSAAATTRRRRGVLLALLDHAVSRGRLTANPLAGVKVKRARVCDAVNPRSVPDYDQAGRLLRAIKHSPNPTDRFLFAFFTVAYLAGTRPGETRAIRDCDIIWPDDITDPSAVPGWGVLMATGSRTEVGAAYTDTHSRGENRELKGRARGEVRMVPLPPEAVAALRDHLSTYPTAPDGRLFYHRIAGDAYATLPGKVYRRTWQRARTTALSAAEMAMGVAARPYDLRHGCASLLIAEGIPTPEIARRLGHSVEVLMTVYTHWFNSQEHTANLQLDQAFRTRGPLAGQPPQQDAKILHLPSSTA